MLLNIQIFCKPDEREKDVTNKIDSIKDKNKKRGKRKVSIITVNISNERKHLPRFKTTDHL